MTVAKYHPAALIQPGLTHEKTSEARVASSPFNTSGACTAKGGEPRTVSTHAVRHMHAVQHACMGYGKHSCGLPHAEAQGR